MGGYVATLDGSITVEEGFNAFLCFENVGGTTTDDFQSYMNDVVMITYNTLASELNAEALSTYEAEQAALAEAEARAAEEAAEEAAREEELRQ